MKKLLITMVIIFCFPVVGAEEALSGAMSNPSQLEFQVLSGAVDALIKKTESFGEDPAATKKDFESIEGEITLLMDRLLKSSIETKLDLLVRLSEGTSGRLPLGKKMDKLGIERGQDSWDDDVW